jgi:hypothetical protein
MLRSTPPVDDFAFKVNIVAVVRVHAADESVARKIVPTVLGAPGTVEIGLANQNNAAMGLDGTVTDVDFQVSKLTRDHTHSEERMSRSPEGRPLSKAPESGTKKIG